MDEIGLLTLAIIVLVPGVFLAVRIARDPFAGLCLWIVLLPITKTVASILGYPHGQGPYVLQKLTLADPVLLVTAAASLVVTDRVGELGKAGRQVVLLLAGFCAAGVIAAIIGHAGPESFVELGTYAWVGISIVVVARLVADREQARRVTTALWWAGVIAIGSGVAGTALLLAGQTKNLLVPAGKVTGLFESANQVQSFLVVVIPILCITALDSRAPRRSRVIDSVLVLGAALTVLASGSRAGIVLVALAVWLILFFTSLRVCAIGTAVAVVLGLAGWGVYQEYRAEMPFAVRRSLSFVDQESYELHDLSVPRSNGLEVWKTVFVEHPVFGVGLDQFRNYVPRVVVSAAPQEAHDSYLAVLAETGMVGAVPMFGLLAIVLVRCFEFLRRAARSREAEARDVARALFVSYVSLLLFGTLHNGLRQRYFWLVVALALILPRLHAGALAERAHAATRRRFPSYRHAGFSGRALAAR